MTSPWFYQNRTMSHAKPLFIHRTGMKLVHSVFALPENRPTKHQIDFLLDILGIVPLDTLKTDLPNTR